MPSKLEWPPSVVDRIRPHLNDGTDLLEWLKKNLSNNKGPKEEPELKFFHRSEGGPAELQTSRTDYGQPEAKCRNTSLEIRDFNLTSRRLQRRSTMPVVVVHNSTRPSAPSKAARAYCPNYYNTQIPLQAVEYQSPRSTDNPLPSPSATLFSSSGSLSPQFTIPNPPLHPPRYSGSSLDLQLQTSDSSGNTGDSSGVICLSCEGKGGRPGTGLPCQVCVSGQRQQQVDLRSPTNSTSQQQQQQQCRGCSGRGRVYSSRDACKACAGTGGSGPTA